MENVSAAVSETVRFHRELIDITVEFLDSMVNAGTDSGPDWDKAVKLNKDARDGFFRAVKLANS